MRFHLVPLTGGRKGKRGSPRLEEGQIAVLPRHQEAVAVVDRERAGRSAGEGGWERRWGSVASRGRGERWGQF